MLFHLYFDFTDQDEAPDVLIVETATNEVVAEIYEQPTHLGGGAYVEIAPDWSAWRGPWSDNPDEWQAGPLALGVLHLMNTALVLTETAR